MAKTADQDFMDSLHRMTAETMQAEIQGYRDRGEAVPPALLSAVIKFLKDNGISVAGGNESPRLQAVVTSLPFPTKEVLKLVQ